MMPKDAGTRGAMQKAVPGTGFKLITMHIPFNFVRIVPSN
jgi:hypothetical protein